MCKDSDCLGSFCCQAFLFVFPRSHDTLSTGANLEAHDPEGRLAQSTTNSARFLVSSTSREAWESLTTAYTDQPGGGLSAHCNHHAHTENSDVHSSSTIYCHISSCCDLVYPSTSTTLYPPQSLQLQLSGALSFWPTTRQLSCRKLAVSGPLSSRIWYRYSPKSNHLAPLYPGLTCTSLHTIPGRLL